MSRKHETPMCDDRWAKVNASRGSWSTLMVVSWHLSLRRVSFQGKIRASRDYTRDPLVFFADRPFAVRPLFYPCKSVLRHVEDDRWTTSFISRSMDLVHARSFSISPSPSVTPLSPRSMATDFEPLFWWIIKSFSFVFFFFFFSRNFPMEIRGEIVDFV